MEHFIKLCVFREREGSDGWDFLPSSLHLHHEIPRESYRELGLKLMLAALPSDKGDPYGWPRVPFYVLHNQEDLNDYELEQVLNFCKLNRFRFHYIAPWWRAE